MKQSRFSWLTGLLILPFFFTSDKVDTFEELLAALEKQTYDYVQEKVYLHLDKPYYSKGDNLWFKAYTVAGPNHTPTPLSQNLFVELVSPAGDVLQRRTIYLEKGIGHGDFLFADSLDAGNYTVRAFTNWMRNFDHEFFFKKSIEVIDPIKPTESQGQPSSGLGISFFPEGGDLVNELPSKVAFEFSSDNETLTGEIIDDTGKVITNFKSVHEGRGTFTLKPEKGRSYFARINSNREKIALPKAREHGLILSANTNSDKENLLINVFSSESEITNRAYLVAHTRGLVGFATQLEWKGPVARIKIPKKDLLHGIVHITLFNENWQSEAERLVFKELEEGLFNVELTTDQSAYGVRDSTTVLLKVTNSANEPIKGFFSLAAFDTTQISTAAYTENILSSLLIGSDLLGNIKNSKQYFLEKEASQNNLDLLLMTHGWRRFVWKDLLANKFPATTYEVQQGFNVSGRISQRNGKKPISKGTLKQMGDFAGIPVFAEATANKQGEFEMKNLLFYENEGILQAEGKKGKNNVLVELDDPQAMDFDQTVKLETTPYVAPVEVVTQTEFALRSRERMSIDSAYSFENVTDLGTVVVEGNKNDVISSNAERGFVFNRGEYGLSVSDLMSRGQKFQSALFVLQGRIPGITITLAGIGGEPIVQMNRKVWSFSNPDPPIQYFVDDAPATLEAVSNMPAEKIERIEVLKGMRATAIYGPSANGGVIAFYTKTADEYEAYYEKLTANGIGLNKNVIGLDLGYYRARQFYAPDYSVERPEHIKPDRRDLIHWEPMILTDENGEAQITFFNADLPTNVQINLEGIWEGGIPIVASTTYEVKKN